MADELHGDSGVGVKLFFEWKYAECLREAAAHYAHAPGTPGPELRADVVDVFNATALEFTGETQVEAWKIGEDGEGGLATFGFGNEATHGANERRQVAEDLGDAYDGDFGVVGDDIDAGSAHLRAAHAEDLQIGALLQRSGQAGCVHVSARFTGGEEERPFSHRYKYLREGAQQCCAPTGMRAANLLAMRAGMRWGSVQSLAGSGMGSGEPGWGRAAPESSGRGSSCSLYWSS